MPTYVTPFRERPDRPHTFVHHTPSECKSCKRQIEGRVVLRDGAAFVLVFCPDCGASERQVAIDGDAYVNAFVAQGSVPTGHVGDHVFKQTLSTCPECLELVRTDVVIRDGRVYFSKACAKCGPSRALVSEDATYYVQAYSHARAGTQPLELSRELAQGCPADCGICPDHEQHTCLPIVEITDYCNLDCPICIVDNRKATHMSRAQFDVVLDHMLRAEGRIESLALSGGEPTSHPEFVEIATAASARAEIGRVLLLTNGLRIGRDRALSERLKALGVYVGLQFDGFDAETQKRLRGRDLREDKQAALRMLEELEIPTQLIVVVARGVNEHEIGRIVELVLEKSFLISLNFQPAAYSGRGGACFGHDPVDRLTIPGIIRRIEEQTNGTLRASDFAPLPCSHPQCVSLTHLLRLDDGSHLPFARFADYRKHANLLRSSATLGATPEMEKTLKDVIYDVYANESRVERGAAVLKALRRAVQAMFPDRALSHKQRVVAGERQAKSISLHHYMDRYDFDLERVRKCCHHYALPDGRVMPACAYNTFHRGSVKGAPA